MATGNPLRLVGVVALALLGVLAGAPALAAEQPRTPQQVEAYFENDLVPRLIEFYGPGDGVNAGVDFDATTTVGQIKRVLVWTEEFQAGGSVENPTELSNKWVASVRVRGDYVGLATVWINPGSDLPELATFDYGRSLATALAAAPRESLLVHDETRSAWFAIDGDEVQTLVPGDSGAAGTLAVAEYQQLVTEDAIPAEEGAPSGFVLAAIILGGVVVILAIFILVPSPRRRETTADGEVTGDADTEPASEADVDADAHEDAAVAAEAEAESVAEAVADADADAEGEAGASARSVTKPKVGAKPKARAKTTPPPEATST